MEKKEEVWLEGQRLEGTVRKKPTSDSLCTGFMVTVKAGLSICLMLFSGFIVKRRHSRGLLRIATFVAS